MSKVKSYIVTMCYKLYKMPEQIQCRMYTYVFHPPGMSAHNSMSVNIKTKLENRMDWTLRLRMTCMEGWWRQSCQMAGYMSNKARNNLQRAINGNISKTFNIVHWNIGPAHWTNKIHTIEAMLLDFKPDIAIIGEANIFPEKPGF